MCVTMVHTFVNGHRTALVTRIRCHACSLRAHAHMLGYCPKEGETRSKLHPIFEEIQKRDTLQLKRIKILCSAVTPDGQMYFYVRAHCGMPSTNNIANYTVEYGMTVSSAQCSASYDIGVDEWMSECIITPSMSSLGAQPCGCGAMRGYIDISHAHSDSRGKEVKEKIHIFPKLL